MWKVHDELLAACWAAARDLRAETDRIERAMNEKYPTAPAAYQRYIERIRVMIEEPRECTQRTWDLYEWARDEGKLC